MWSFCMDTVLNENFKMWKTISYKPKILTPPGMGQKASRIRYKDSQSWKNWNIWSLFQIQQNWEQRCPQNFMASYSSSQQEQ